MFTQSAEIYNRISHKLLYFSLSMRSITYDCTIKFLSFKWNACGDRASDLLSSLFLLPSLLSLNIEAVSDHLFLDKMGRRDSSSEGFEICPLLQDLTLRVSNPDTLADFEGLVGSIISRWHAPPRTTRRVTLTHAPFSFAATSDPSTLSGLWEPLMRCIKDGLVFEARMES